MDFPIPILIYLIVYVGILMIIIIHKTIHEESHKPARYEARKVSLQKILGDSNQFPQPKILDKPEAEQGYVVLNGIKRKLEDCSDL